MSHDQFEAEPKIQSLNPMPEQNPTYSVERDDSGTVATVTLERAQCLDVAGKAELTDLFTRMGARGRS